MKRKDLKALYKSILNAYGDAPVMNIDPRDRNLIEVCTAGWRERLEALGWQYIADRPFASAYKPNL